MDSTRGAAGEDRAVDDGVDDDLPLDPVVELYGQGRSAR